MQRRRSLLAVVVVVCCGMAVLVAAGIDRRVRTYEVQPYITVPEYRTDAARAIDAYERLMERHMDVMEQHLVGMNKDVQQATVKLDAIDAKLTRLSIRMARIEKALGIDVPPEPAGVKTQGRVPSQAPTPQTRPKPAPGRR